MPDGNGGQTLSWFSTLWAWFLLIGLSLWGGTANYVRKLKQNKQPFSVVELIGEWVISGFAGFIAALACIELGFSFAIAAAAAGVAGHMGGRSIFILEQVTLKWWEKRYGVKLPDSPPDKD